MDTIKELVRRRRGQMLLHSYVYYFLNNNIVSDHTFQAWADELAALQAVHGYEHFFHDEQFKDWTGASGYHLVPTQRIMAIAHDLIDMENTC